MYKESPKYALNRRAFLCGSATLLALGGSRLGALAADIATPENLRLGEAIPPPISTGYPSIAFSPSLVSASLSFPLIGEGTDMGAPQHLLYLGLVARLDANLNTRASAATRLAQQVDYHFAAGYDRFNRNLSNGPYHMIGWGAGYDGSALATLVCCLAKHTPAVWDVLSADAKDRLDWYMRCATYLASYCCNKSHNSGNTLFNGLGLGNKMLWYRNNNQASASRIAAACIMYWGSLSAFNSVLAAYDAATLRSKIRAQYKWATLYNTFDHPDVVNSFTKGAPYSGDKRTIQMHSQGIRRALTQFKCLYFDPAKADKHFDLTRWYDDHLATTTNDPQPKDFFIRHEIDFNFCVNVNDGPLGSAPACSPGEARLRPGLSRSPHFGQRVMAQEYALGARSSQHYVGNAGIQLTQPLLEVMMALGWWKSPHIEMDAALATVRKGLEVMWYREGNWWDAGTSKCGYAESSFFHKNRQDELFEKMIKPDLVWPGENV